MTRSSAANAGLNLAELTADARALIEADKTACLIRWKCRGLPEKEKQRLGPQLLAAVPESARPAVVAALKARAGK
jgi:hypothetical protein